MEIMPQNSIYDESPELYDDLLVRQRFKNPARDLIALLGIQQGHVVLDIGTGTGIALEFASEYLQGNGIIIGVDPSEEMLDIARKKGRGNILIKGGLPETNFLTDTFDRISASFVLSHVSDYDLSLLNLYKILKPNGVFGATFWREGQTEYNFIWDTVVKKYINKNYLDVLSKQFIPWEAFFENPENIYNSLDRVGFKNISIVPKEYSVDMSLDDYLACRYNLLAGKYLKKILSTSQWETFKSTIRSDFQEKVGTEVRYVGRVNITICNKTP